MPAEGIDYLPKKELMTYEEILRATSLFRDLGVNKVRITGGEPFLRKGLINFLKELKTIKGLEKVHITTNGVLTAQYIEDLKRIGIDGVNLSIDSIDKENFKKITRRDEFDNVFSCLQKLIEADIHTKLNVVVMKGKNEHEIPAIAELAKHRNIHVRFIEEMPFNGSDYSTSDIWNHQQIIHSLESNFKTIERDITPKNDPATLYQIKGHEGKIGVIPAFSRTFCGTCNRIRMTALGTIKNCLYDDGVLDIKQLMRTGEKDESIKSELMRISMQKAQNGHQAEAARKNTKVIGESMSTIGG